MFMLTDAISVASHGSFPSLSTAVNYARSLQQYDLCLSFNVGTYVDGSFQIVYREVANPEAQKYQ